MSPGKSDKVFSRSSVECFLSDFFLSLSRVGLVVLGDEGGLDSFMPTAALEFEQPSLVELPTKALCVVPRADRKSTRLNSSHVLRSRMPSSA